MPILLGCIADDFTGATDVAGMLVKHGLRTVQMIDDPHGQPVPEGADAVVISLKFRTSPVERAIKESLSSLAWLQAAGCRQFYFKYCSTFDSTPKGNIGPVAEALMDALDTDFTIACPAFPDNRRTVYQGHLFVGPDPLNESSMRFHPLTPMTDANLIRVLGAQVKRRVGLIDFVTVRQGPAAVRERIASLREQGFGFAIADAIANKDLETLGDAGSDLELLTGGSGLAMGLPENFRRSGLTSGNAADALPSVGGPRAIIAGSCSAATQKQVAVLRERHPALRLDLASLQTGNAVGNALEWASSRVGEEPVLIYSTAPPEEVKAVQARLGEAESSTLIEDTLAEIAKRLVDDFGVGRLIVAGGETSGAVVKALGVKRLRIGPEICPGVPWTTAETGRGDGMLALALKSGNFGAPDFFLTAWNRLP